MYFLFAKTRIILILFLFCITQPALAGAWAQPKGGYYTKLTFIYSDADGLHGSNFPALFNDYALYFYGEYGVLERATIVASLPAIKQSINEANSVRGATTGFLAGDFEFHLKYQFLERPLVASVVTGTKIPLVYDVKTFPPLGNGETDLDVRLSLGASLYPIPVYMTGDVGYRQRGGEFIDEIHFIFEAGYTIWERYLMRILTTGIRNVKESEGESNLLGFPLAQEQFRLGGGVIYKLSQQLEIDVTFLNTISGNNIPKANELFVGIAFKK